MENIADKYRVKFEEEIFRLADSLEDSLIALEKEQGSKTALAETMRALHTIKGTSGMFGYEGLSRFAHGIENSFALLRDADVGVSRDFITQALTAHDRIKAIVAKGGEPTVGDDDVFFIARLIDNANRLISSAREKEAQKHPSRRIFTIHFAPGPDSMRNGLDPMDICRELKTLGQLYTVAHTGAVPPLDRLDPERVYASWDLVLIGECAKSTVLDAFIFLDEASMCQVEELEEDLERPDEPPRLGEILMRFGDITGEQVENAIRLQKRMGELLLASGATTPERLEAALVEQSIIRSDLLAAKGRESVSVSTQKLNTLGETIQDLLELESRLNRLSRLAQYPELEVIAGELGQVSERFRRGFKSIRMVPAVTLYGKLSRLVRDKSLELGKEVEFVGEGGEAQIDRAMADLLGDVLLHLCQNSLDHGIEPPQAREAAQKSRKGRITIKASSRHGRVEVVFCDDGKGLDEDLILAKATEAGIFAPGQTPAREKILDAIFSPGFSTAERVTGLSGRGVGMDVVKRRVTEMNGTIKTESVMGRGTTFTIGIPLPEALLGGIVTG